MLRYVDLNLTALAPRQVYLLFLSSFMIAQALYSPDPCFDSLNIVIVIVIVIFNLHNPSFREQICSNFIEKSGYQVQWAIQTLIQRHPKTALCWIQSYLYASVSNTDPLRIAQYTTLCTFLRKNWNLEFEIHGNWFFSFFLRVVSLEKKCLSPKYFWGFFKISPGANNPEEFLFNKQHIVQWTAATCLLKWLMRSTVGEELACTPKSRILVGPGMSCLAAAITESSSSRSVSCAAKAS